ncbi:MAG: hypothetical protein SNJ73_05080 [Acetobacteraceae bacterium]
MIAALVETGVRLACLLEEENRALAALDLAAAAALAERKRQAVECFAAAEQTVRKAGSRAGSGEREAARALGERLAALAATNRRMLERAIAAQDALVRVLAESARPVDGRYASTGAPRAIVHDAPAVTLAASL